jgi:hypothetical protein
MQGGCHQTFLGNDTTMALQNPNFPQKNMAISENLGIYKASRNIHVIYHVIESQFPSQKTYNILSINIM